MMIMIDDDDDDDDDGDAQVEAWVGCSGSRCEDLQARLAFGCFSSDDEEDPVDQFAYNASMLGGSSPGPQSFDLTAPFSQEVLSSCVSLVVY